MTADQGQNIGKSYDIAPGKGLTVRYGTLSYFVTIRTDSPKPRTLFMGHLCDKDRILNGDDAVLFVDASLNVSCVKLKDFVRRPEPSS